MKVFKGNGGNAPVIKDRKFLLMKSKKCDVFEGDARNSPVIIKWQQGY